MYKISISFNKIHGFVLFLTAGVLMLGMFAQSARADYDVPGIAHDSSYEKVYTPVMTMTSVIIDDDEDPPNEPNIGEAKYLKYPALTSVDERIKRLLFGIETYIRPEYDQYGHEIRRYMSRIGNMKMYSDTDYMLEQYRNVKKAYVIADFWKDHLEKEIREIEKIIAEDDSIALSTRTVFKQNRMTVRSFIMSLKSWIDTNEKLMRHIAQTQEEIRGGMYVYTVKYPEILIARPKVRVDYHNFLSMRTAKLKDIKQYTPFALMVY